MITFNCISWEKSFSKNDIITSIIIIFINVERKYIQSKITLKTYITHTPPCIHCSYFSVCARVLSIFSLSRNVNRKNPFTLHFFARVFALTTIETVHISLIIIEKFSHLLQTYYEKFFFFFVYIDESIDIAQFFCTY